MRSSSTDELNAVFSEIVSVVFADRSADGGPKISSVNGVWIEQTEPIDAAFKNLFENIFKAVFNRVDFRSKAEQVRIELNKWAEDHTNGLIKDLLPPGSVSSLTHSVYGNALYFKGAWEVPFEKSRTMDREFHLLSGTSVSVPFMSSSRNQYIKAYHGFKVLRIPYRQGGDVISSRFPYGKGDVDTNRSFPYRQGGVDTNRFPYPQRIDATSHSVSYRQGLCSTNGRFSMYLYLPDKNNGLDDLVKAMTSTSGFLDCHVPQWKVEVNEFRIPKFKIAYGLDGKELGLRSMDLYHKACVEIDEEGAEAAAATFTGVPCGSMRYMEPPKRIDFVADHPFLFLIREDKTGIVLFVGQIFDPSSKSS